MIQRVSAVWLRNFLYFRKSFLANVLWTTVEPVLYLFAIGFSLGKAVGNFEGVPYVNFYVPALLSTTAMMVPFFEGTFGSYTKLVFQKTYATILLTPISALEIVLGEVLWCASKGIFGFTCVAVVAHFFGALPIGGFLLAFPVLALLAFLFSAMGMFVASFAKNYDSFTYWISGFIVPMSLFSGTYFPLKDLPDWIQWLSWLLPLTHGVQAIRGLMLNSGERLIGIHVGLLATMSLVFLVWSIRRIRNRLEG